MGFNKIYIDKDRIISAWKAAGAPGVSELWTKYDGIILTDRMSMYIGTIMDKDEQISQKMKS